MSSIRNWFFISTCAWALLLAGNAYSTSCYVATNGNDSAAGTNWLTAKLTIQAGINAAQAGGVVWVSNGVYSTGVYVMPPYAATNRIVITNGITVRSVEGPGSTLIVGAWDPVTTNGGNAVRCAYVGTNSALIGFTLTNGATCDSTAISDDQNGGGLYCAANAVISNCVISGNAAAGDGGGGFQGLFSDCTFAGNLAGHAGGGARQATLTRCMVAGNAAFNGGGSGYGSLSNSTITGNTSIGGGGGSYYDNLVDCVISSNHDASTYSGGGGTYGSTLKNCLLTGNSATNAGGGACNSYLYNCTVTSNSAPGGGLYGNYGGGVYGGYLSNTVLYANTSIYGGGACDATLDYCTVANNSAIGSYACGGGVQGCTVNHSTLCFNTASYNGGGASETTLNNCTVTSNSVTSGYGGGSYGGNVCNSTITFNTAANGAGSCNGKLYNCTVIGNHADSSGGGSYGGTVYNSILYFNTAPGGPNYYGSTIYSSCTTPDPGGTGNITADPQFINADTLNFHLKTGSPCVDAGSNAYVSGTTDLGGAPRIVNGIVDLGAYEWLSTVTVLAPGGTATGGGLYPSGSNIIISASARGHWFFTAWNDGSTSAVRTITVPATDITYTATLTQYLGALTFYVATNGSDGADGRSWAMSKLTLQGAIADTAGGDTVLASNGVYASGAQVFGVSGTSNRVSVTNAITLRSVSGPSATAIVGAWVPGTTNGASAVRGVYLGTNAILSGFTVSNGATRTDEYAYKSSGGGVWCDPGAILTNCILTRNSAAGDAGGCNKGTLYACLVYGNTAGENGGGTANSDLYSCALSNNTAYYGGGCIGGTLTNCLLAGNRATYGGGTDYGTLSHCQVVNNTATEWGGGGLNAALEYCILTGNQATAGGGVWMSRLYNCFLSGNSATVYGGGGSWNCELYNCTVVSNSSPGYGGGSYCDTSVHNCIVCFNTGNTPYPNCYSPSALSVICTPDPLYFDGAIIIAANPRFAAPGSGDFRLATNSPCIDAGINAFAVGATDLDGKPRIIHGYADLGAYESLLPGWDTDGDGVPDWWTWTNFGHCTGQSNDCSRAQDDASGTGQDNLMKYMADLNPHDPNARFMITALTRAGATNSVSFSQTSSNRLYLLQWTTNMVSGAWTNSPTGSPSAGSAGTMTLRDTNTASATFYRIRIQLPR